MLRVLIVDDDPSLALLFRTLLERHGCKVVECHSADAALRAAPEFSPEALLCDLHVEASSGIDVSNRIKEMLPNCRIVLMSGADAVYIRNMVDASVQVLQKPIGVEDILAAFSISSQRRAVNE